MKRSGSRDLIDLCGLWRGMQEGMTEATLLIRVNKWEVGRTIQNGLGGVPFHEDTAMIEGEIVRYHEGTAMPDTLEMIMPKRHYIFVPTMGFGRYHRDHPIKLAGKLYGPSPLREYVAPIKNPFEGIVDPLNPMQQSFPAVATDSSDKFKWDTGDVIKEMQKALTAGRTEPDKQEFSGGRQEGKTWRALMGIPIIEDPSMPKDAMVFVPSNVMNRLSALEQGRWMKNLEKEKDK